MHPFVESLCDEVCHDLEAVADWLKKYARGLVEVKGRDYLHECMAHYRSAQYPHDQPMQQLIEGSNYLLEKWDQEVLSSAGK
jgi:DNA-binding FrmR family transcriptional regulator